MTRKEAIKNLKIMLKRGDPYVVRIVDEKETLGYCLRSLERDERYCMLEDEDFHAKWKFTNALIDPWECSNCGFEASDEFDFCPGCGCDMRDINEEG